jgi:hypothetical protein
MMILTRVIAYSSQKVTFVVVFLRERRVSSEAQKSFLMECRAKMTPKSKVKKLQSRS